MIKVIILAFLALAGQNSWAQIREFQTTRLMSTTGAGVASILSTEASVLNPAASAFFSGSSFSYQSYSTDLTNEDDARNNKDFPDNRKSQGFFMADNSGPIKGGTAYITQNENDFERERIVLHGAAPMGKATSLGVSYNYIKDKLPETYPDKNKTHHQASIGFTHIVDEKTILGLVILDPTRTTPGEERAIAGFQYSVAERFTLIGDFGAQYTKAVSEEYLWRAAIQLNVFSDFYLRFGKFYDNITHFKGNGWGASWIGPRFGVEFAQRFSEQYESDYIFKDEKLVDTSFSAIIKF